MDSPLANVVQGYSELASSLLEEWSTHATKVAAKLDQRGYDADSAAADLSITASLAAESWLRLMLEAVEAVAILTASGDGRLIVDSEPFSTHLPGATLKLAGPLVNGFASDTLPTALVTIEPAAQLGPGETDFYLCANATGRRAGTYWGRVVASAAGAEDPVIVWIAVP